ncbi:hypothetical protein E2C01_008856 [Portunus trituberculatus]|uniref:Uncharacterized protein n=1 Tax=Portunus trituberculatus TaxID=210409 RepID=A0A5B7D405_PORTR|nr:hypothetical protein [Portunus trituberculatus]
MDEVLAIFSSWKSSTIAKKSTNRLLAQGRDGEWLTEVADMVEYFRAFSGVFSNAFLDNPSPIQTCETVLEFDGYIFIKVGAARA